MQIIFNEISAAELSRLPTQTQFQLLDALDIKPADLEGDTLDKRFGILVRDGLKLYRCRAGDFRIYFAVEGGNVRVHRLLSGNTLKDFFFRTNLPMSEDEELAKSKNFWKLIDEGARTLRI
jgi:mRNA-degrading endonuclease RelE of RelBE toxin-antitoxin system